MADQATPAPVNVYDQSDEYEHADIGSYLHWFDGWKGHQGTVVQASEWEVDEYGRDTWGDVRERLVVVDITETTGPNGYPTDGGFAILRLRRSPYETWQTRAIYHADSLASSGIRYAGTADEFVAAVDQHNTAWRSLDRAIAETDPNNPNREWR